MNNKNIIDKKNHAYKHQRAYYHNNKQRLNKNRVILNYKKKFGGYLNSEKKIDIFKKHKKIYLELKNLDKDMLQYFLNK